MTTRVTPEQLKSVYRYNMSVRPWCEAMLEMRGYNDVVAASLAEADVGGSEDCVDNVRAAFQQLGAAMQTKFGRRWVEDSFNVCPLNGKDGDKVSVSGNVEGKDEGLGDDADEGTSKGDLKGKGKAFPLDDPANRMELVSALSEVFPAQSNDPSCTLPACDIRAACVTMNTETPRTTSRLERLAELTSLAFGGECVDVDHVAGLAALNATTLPPDYEKGAGDFDRSWLWQTCTEFGFYQTCVPGRRITITRSFHFPFSFHVGFLYSCSTQLNSVFLRRECSLNKIHRNVLLYPLMKKSDQRDQLELHKSVCTSASP